MKTWYLYEEILKDMPVKLHADPLISGQLSLFLNKECEPKEIDTVYQYLVLLSPPDEMKEKVKRLKYKLNNQAYLGSYNIYSVPHITLAKLQSVNRMHQRFGRELQKEFTEHGELEVKLKGFNFFNLGESHKTIYLQIENEQKITAIYRQLHAYFGMPLMDYVPHLTVAKTISSDTFNELYPSLELSDFEGVFTCNHIQILERTIKGPTVSPYKPIKKIRLA